MPTARVFDVQKFSIHDGPGIRTTVFFKGCPLSCLWCHNPESRGREPFVYYDPDHCLACGECVAVCPEGALALGPEGVATDPELCRVCGRCAEACPAEARRLIGRDEEIDSLLDQLERDRPYYEESGGGVTFSGGEPLLQWRALLELLTVCGARGLHRAVDTTGFASPSVLRRVARETDLFLYDLKAMDPELHRRVTGVPLQPILDNLALLLSLGARVRIRIPLIPGVTSDESIDRTATFLASIPPVEGVSLLPFHESARDKHRKFGFPWLLESDEEIPDERVASWKARLESGGLHVTVGG
jgi:pyruvate formate lyase activating enzyme